MIVGLSKWSCQLALTDQELDSATECCSIVQTTHLHTAISVTAHPRIMEGLTSNFERAKPLLDKVLLDVVEPTAHNQSGVV